MIQKPLAISVAAGRLIVDEARRRGLSLGVTENLRYAPEVRIARWVIEQGYLGDLQMIARGGLGTAEWSPDRVVAETPWRHRKLEAGGGASLDIGVHLLHELRYLAGEIDIVSALTRIFEPTRYLPSGEAVACDVDDAFFATFQLAGGAVGQLAFSWAGHGPPTGLPERRVIYGTRGSLLGDRLVRDGAAPVSAAELFRAEADPETVAALFPFGLQDSFALGLLDFLRAIESGRDPQASGREGLLDLAAAFAICESSALGRPVRVSQVLDGTVRDYQAEIDRHYGLLP